ncbi:hypothetical protein Patl1_13320 [Pistacia atlantica]|uniref:Uncharacterized protein n=1 Tax=Pistacia atlantica TaxID=434234 RepID=A0ACC1AWJ3_9ROSI|nr:hypothetical protein Patl1_13320 [Pistacia atlantica]
MSRADVLPDSYTLPIILKAVCQFFAVEMGRQLHSVAIRLGLVSNEFCESGLICLYSKVGEFETARLSQGGRAKEAIATFIELKRWGFEPDGITMVSVTSACGSLGDLGLALQLHRMSQCNVSSWTSMIVGFAMNGHVNEALECFHCMREAGVRPNHVTFVGVLSACVHGGKVREGKHFFDMMKNVYRITPQLPHYGCMVDLLGRAGLLDEAREMVERMPLKANVVIWGCLMGACEKFGNVKIGESVAKHLQELEPWNDGVFVVLSNIYASRGQWEEVERVRGIMTNKKLAKVPGYSLATNSY